MNNILAVYIGESFKKLVHDIWGLFFRKFLWILTKLLNKLTTRAQLHAEIDEPWIVICLIVVDNIAVVHSSKNHHLVLDVLDLLLSQILLINFFNGQLALRVQLVGSFVYSAERSFAKAITVDVVSLDQVWVLGLRFLIYFFFFGSATKAPHIFFNQNKEMKNIYSPFLNH